MQNGIPPEGWPPGYGPNGQNLSSTNPFVNPNSGYSPQVVQGIPAQGWPPGYTPNGQNLSSTNPFVNPTPVYTQQVVSVQGYPPTQGYTQQVQYPYNNIPVASAQSKEENSKLRNENIHL